MPAVVGVALALAVCAVARGVGFDRDRGFYPTMLAVIASYYVQFAVMGGSPRALIQETLVMGVLLAAAAVLAWLVRGSRPAARPSGRASAGARSPGQTAPHWYWM